MNANTALRQIARSSRQAYRNYNAPFRIAQSAAVPRRHLVSTTPAALRQCKHVPSSSIATQIRRESSEAKPLTDRPAESAENTDAEGDDVAARKALEPAYELTFTCRKCMNRSSHRVTKQAYHFGTTLITCSGCKNRHLISDHMKIFSDKGITLEDILKEKGQYLRKGRLGEDGDIEFYDEGSNEIGQAEAQAQEQGHDGR
ncbi:uncharacterized protein LTR77_006397 [Saxophila tyrrhenica]|uniref:DNL-type domain-containing protein n=1 Tax=Saxophila tyrrhenica TaxID=1690608 RepID=A0AAV9P7R8_9PEZI|nr:hypothetical protein LTR77_006397 [Saxophila tyrrhenica]